MAIQADTTGHSLRERSPMPRVASGGPVSKAIRVMLDADPDQARIRELRRAIAMRIEADIDLLDALAGDVDLEDGGDDEPSLGGGSCDDRELDDADDEDGGDTEGGTDDNGIVGCDSAAEQGFTGYGACV